MIFQPKYDATPTSSPKKSPRDKQLPKQHTILTAKANLSPRTKRKVLSSIPVVPLKRLKHDKSRKGAQTRSRARALMEHKLAKKAAKRKLLVGHDESSAALVASIEAKKSKSQRDDDTRRKLVLRARTYAAKAAKNKAAGLERARTQTGIAASVDSVRSSRSAKGSPSKSLTKSREEKDTETESTSQDKGDSTLFQEIQLNTDSEEEVVFNIRSRTRSKKLQDSPRSKSDQKSPVRSKSRDEKPSTPQKEKYSSDLSSPKSKEKYTSPLREKNQK